MKHKYLFRIGLLLLGASLFPQRTLLAVTVRVPADFPTIQTGLNAVSSGDTVLVAANTYNENLVWPSQDGIVLLSEDGASTTIIDGTSSGRVIYFPNFAYSPSTILSGFTIRNGLAVQGAGIYIYRGSPSIYRNVVRRNIAVGTSTWVYGGGILCNGVGAPLIMNNAIHGNVARGEYWNYGGSIFIDGQNSAVIIGNRIEFDSVIGGHWNYGAGIYCEGGSSPDIRHNVIRNNVATQGDRGHGVGIYVGINSNAYILSNLIYENTAQSGSWNYGAGILINSAAEVINNTIVGNRCLGGSWNYGGGIRIYDSTNTIANNIIVSNSASSGGGIYASTGDHATLLNNDVWNNAGGNYVGIAPGAADISVDPLFVTGPLGDFYLSHIAAGQGMDSPCIDYGYTTAANLELDTFTTRVDSVSDMGIVDLGYHYPTDSFILGVFKISAFSAFPKRDFVLLKWHTEGEWETLRWLIQRKEKHEAYQTIGIIEGEAHAHGPSDYCYRDSTACIGRRYWYQLVNFNRNGQSIFHGPLLVDLSTNDLVPPTITLSCNGPNPFHTTTSFNLGIPLKSRNEITSIAVYDKAGRKVKILFTGTLTPGYYRFIWDGRDQQRTLLPSCSYFLLLRSGKKYITIRTILLALP
jgi:hypothetical protein